MNIDLTELRLGNHNALVGGKMKNGPLEDDGYAKSESGKSTRSISSKGNETSVSASASSGILSVLSDDFIGSIRGKMASQKLKEVSKPGFRLSFRAQNRAKVVNDNELGYIKFDEIDFLKVHTVEELPNNSGSDWLVQDEFVDKFTMSLSKINVVAVLESSHVSGEEPMVKLTFANVSRKYELILLHLLWINMDEREIETITSIKDAINIPIYQQAEFYIPVEKFELSKRYKMVIYYGILDLLFCREFALRLTTRPINTLSLDQMEHYFPEPALRTLDKCHYKEPKSKNLNEDEKLLKEKIISYEKLDGPSRLNSTNYYSMLKLMLQMEDETDSKRSLRHDQYSQNIKHEYGKRYSLIINNERLEAAINEYTRIWITPQVIRSAEVTLNEINMRKHREAVRNRDSNDEFILKPPRNKKERIYGSVVKVQGNMIYFELNEPLSRFVKKTGVKTSNEKYFIRFMSDRTSITLEHRALEYMNTENTSHFFFPSVYAVNVRPTNETHPSSYSGEPLEWTSSDVNDEQKIAIINILKGTAYPYPYILYGPPGTGKTKTLVEAISQIMKNDTPSEYILVCATSNSACDEIAKRLIEDGKAGGDKVFRIFSKSVLSKDISIIPQCVLNASNLSKGEHYFPSLDILCTYKVIVCTLTTAGRLSQGKINPQHFSHIFIDEAASATESQTLIALSGLCTSLNKIHANIIFAGDPKQLGPLIKSQQAVKMGYGVSMLERLVTTNSLYMKNSKTKRFNENYVTQLVCNYRSHESILHVSNELYYDNNLQVCAPIANINWFIGSSILEEPSFPVVFHSVRGQTIKEKNETSPYNHLEIDTAIHYLNRIFKFKCRTIRQADIGIISPYRKQCDELTERCAKHGWPEIKIGSVEVFQGQEKPIIIVSTVRSNMNNIGFLDNKKRLNVLMTRAKCLLIIIGDADTLARDEHWKYVIQYCEKANAMIYH